MRDFTSTSPWSEQRAYPPHDADSSRYYHVKLLRAHIYFFFSLKNGIFVTLYLNNTLLYKSNPNKTNHILFLTWSTRGPNICKAFFVEQ